MRRGQRGQGLALVVKIVALVESFANISPCPENERMFTRGRDVVNRKKVEGGAGGAAHALLKLLCTDTINKLLNFRAT